MNPQIKRQTVEGDQQQKQQAFRVKGDFAQGQRTLSRPDTQPDFARGQDTEPVREGPDYARGQHAETLIVEASDYARGLRGDEGH